ncbi:hypothetical protein BAOM_2007 [Peribacillus asahii]|uniref:Uncharacterized protein n=1 Tax=Peribacillus asahii TaxID=228899 RepID=A0A3Q9RME9_9BACI|nr:hypothetical protein BAOM_2007 [Peribacillus asahii]
MILVFLHNGHSPRPFDGSFFNVFPLYFLAIFINPYFNNILSLFNDEKV